MIFDSNKERGNAGLAIAIAYFGANGYTVSVPLNDTQDYDLIVEINGELQKVQIKATGYKTNGNYTVNLKSAGGTKGTIYKRVNETKVDLLFVLCENMDMYLIPKEEFLKYSSSMSLNESRKKYKVYL